MNDRRWVVWFAAILVIGGCLNCTAKDSALLQLESDEKNRKADRWDSPNSPHNFTGLGAEYEFRLDQLPLSGQAKNIPWAGWYWATYRDAINYRWAGEDSESPTAKYARAFGLDPQKLEDTVSALSGIDSRARGTGCTENNQCDTRTGEVCAKRYGENSGYCIPKWFGQCHAWAPASVMEPEPIHPVTINGVTFEPQDIKALITYVYNNVQTDVLGMRCHTNDSDVEFDEYGRPVSHACRDTNPGSLHIIMTNWLGLHGKSFIEDRTWDDEVWNQPVRGFKVTMLDEMSELQAAQMLNVTATEVFSGKVAYNEWKNLGSFTGSAGLWNIKMSGTGDADLFVRKGAEPTEQDFDCRPYASGSVENCVLTVADSEKVYISIKGFVGYALESSIKVHIQYPASDMTDYGYVFNHEAVSFYHVQTDLQYIAESEPTDNGDLDEDEYTVTTHLEYILEVDNEGKIIGGEWLKLNPHIDFLWVPVDTARDFWLGEFTFEYKKIRELLDKSISGTFGDRPSSL